MAQRTFIGQTFASASLACSFTSVGTELFFGKYNLGGFWATGLSAVNRARYVENTDEVASFLRLEVPYVREYRLFSLPGRVFNVYAGGDACLGYEFLDPFGILPSASKSALENSGYKYSSFLYGVSARAEAEWFPSTAFGVFAEARLPITFGTSLQVVGVEVSVGARFGF